MPRVDISVAAAVSQVFNAAGANEALVAEALYSQVLRMHPEVHVLVWPKQRIVSFGIGPKKMSQHYAYIGIQSTHVNLGFYQGATLETSATHLEGTGKNLRHLKLHTVREAESATVSVLVQRALNELSNRA